MNQQLTELQKLRSADARRIIANLATESMSFAEFRYWMREYDAPEWFNLGKCWQEETGEEVQP